MAKDTETRTEKGASLARGPALVLGTILLVAGLYFLYKQHSFPKFANFPDGRAPVHQKVFFGIFGANGWTGMLTAAGGGLLLFGAAQHLLAKTMSLIVGVALGAAAIIALVSGNVLGMAAANGWTEILWGVAAAILLFNTVIPRRRREVETGRTAAAGATAAPAGGRVHEREPAGAREPVADRGAVPAREGEARGAGAGAGNAAEGAPARREDRPAGAPGETGNPENRV